MKSAWVDADAQAVVSRYEANGVAADLALRVYTTRLLGRDPKLVLHGGGNTSVKTRTRDLNGETVDVLCVKGSGWDMGQIEPPGLPAVRLDQLRKTRSRSALSDEEMVRVQRANLIEWTAGMCALVGVPTPPDAECLTLAEEAAMYITPRVNSAFPGAVEDCFPAMLGAPAFQYLPVDTFRLVIMEAVIDAAILQPGACLLDRVAVLDAVHGGLHAAAPALRTGSFLRKSDMRARPALRISGLLA